MGPTTRPPVTSSPFGRGCPATDESGVASAVRSVNELVRALLVEGCRQSPTLQRLADAIGRTDGIVYVEIGACPIRALRGCLLHLINDTGNARYLWIRLSPNADPRELVGTMAHELQHAREILEHNEVRSLRGLLEFYHSFESRAYSSQSLIGLVRNYETDEAIAVAAAVRAELASPPSVLSADDRD